MLKWQFMHPWKEGEVNLHSINPFFSVISTTPNSSAMLDLCDTTFFKLLVVWPDSNSLDNWSQFVGLWWHFAWAEHWKPSMPWLWWTCPKGILGELTPTPHPFSKLSHQAASRNYWGTIEMELLHKQPGCTQQTLTEHSTWAHASYCHPECPRLSHVVCPSTDSYRTPQILSLRPHMIFIVPLFSSLQWLARLQP